MSIEKLHPFHAMKAGSQVWFLPEKNISGWTRFLDWHINFLVAQSNLKSKQDLSGILKGILSEEQIELQVELRDSYEQTLLSTHEYLPNTSTVMVRNFQDIESWFRQIQMTVAQLKLRSVRIFLPKGIDIDTTLNLCKDSFEDVQLTLVEDINPGHT